MKSTIVCLFILLIAGNAFAKPSPNDVAKLMQKTADWQIAHFRDTYSGRKKPHHIRDWTNGALYVGMLKWARMSSDPRYMEWLKYIGDESDWELHWRTYMADDHVVGQLYLDLYRDFNDPSMITKTQERLDYIMANPSQEPITLDNYAHLQRWTWCDALFMGPPVWAKLAAITGEKKYLDWMMAEFEVTRQHLWDEESALFYRDNSYIGKLVDNKKIFWSRGNGWVFGGLTLLMDELSPSSEEYKYFKDIYIKMAKALVKLQTNEGHWAMSLENAERYPTPETSGTAFFTFGLAWGINKGILSANQYEPAIHKAWSALESHITEDGMLGYVQPIGAAPGEAWPDKSEVYGTGAFLAAGAEYYKLLGGKGKAKLPASKTLDSALKTSADAMAIEKASAKASEKNVLTARFVPERQDDFAWENDLVAFRVFGPALRSSKESSGTDCWLKRVTYPIIDKWYDKALNHGQSYHEDHGEGYDPYHVGSSSGCGATALWIDGEQHSLNTFVSYKNLSVTKEQLTFTLVYEDDIKGQTYREEKHIRLKPGQRLFAAQSTFYRNGKVAPYLPVSVGLSTHDDKATATFDNRKNILSTWEEIDGYALGTAIIIDASTTSEPQFVSASKPDKSHALFVARTDASGSLSYYAGYGWEKAGEITSLDNWLNYLNQFINSAPYQ